MELASNRLPEGFFLEEQALYAMDYVGKGKDARRAKVAISTPIRVLAETCGESGLGHGRLLEWQDSQGHIRRWAMPLRMLVIRGGDEVFSTLLDSGLSYINLTKKHRLLDYLMACKPSERITCVERTGWHGKAYVLPNDSIGPDAGRVILQTSGFAGNDFNQAGTLSAWQHQVAALAVGNSRLCFALSMAFAAPLLTVAGMEGGGFHFKGFSGDGKTTVAECAASVYGNPATFVSNWRATGNAIEGLASRRNDALLCLDEMGQGDGAEAGQVAYMLANGQGKARSRQDGNLQERKLWRLIFLSTGELSLEDHAAGAGKRTQAGMEARIIQIPTDINGSHGAFENLHGRSWYGDLCEELKNAASRHHGTAFRAFIEGLARDLDLHSERLRGEIRRIADKLTPTDAGGQVGRTISRFALVAAAGELATELGITNWPPGEAIRASRCCFEAWLNERGHLGNHEDAATLRQIRQFFTTNQYSRFADWFDPKHRPAEMAGYRRGPLGDGNKSNYPDPDLSDHSLFYVLPEGWREITKGRDPKRAARLAFDAGWLAKTAKPQPDGLRLQVLRQLPGNNKYSKVYLFNYSVIADTEECDNE